MTARDKRKNRLIISDSFKPFLRVLHIFCCYSSNPVTSKLYRVYSTVEVTFLILIPCFLKTIDVLQSFTYLEEALETLLPYVTLLIYTLKAISFIIHKNRVRTLLNCLDLDIFQPRNAYQRNRIEKEILTTKKYMVIFAAVCCFTCTLFDLRPLFIYRQERDRPTNFWYPMVNATISPWYEITYAYESIYIVMHGLVHSVLDAIHILCMAFIIGQLHSIEDTLVNLRRYAAEEANISQESNATEIIHVEMNKLLIKCIHKHRALRTFVNGLNKVYTNNFFLILANCVITMAFLMYKMSKVATLDFAFIYMMFYFCSMNTIVFVCNWHGNEITYKSGEMYAGIYLMDWPGTPIWLQKNLIFTIIHLQIPMKLYALNFFVLCFQSYISVMKTSWSYFLMLTAVSDN